ncbi:MAG: amidohydrolase family protein, partial [Candidatus Rifleibacteriota bacterium]
MFEKVLKNGQVFLGDRFIKADLAIEGEKIAAIGIELAGKKEIDTAGKWVLPGIIDAHTHFSLPFAGAVSSDDFFSGTRAGAIGGVTTIIDFLAQKGNEGFKDSFSSRMAIAEGQAAVDYSFHACIGRFSEQVKNEMAELENLGLTSLKVFMAYGKSGLMQSDASMLEIMKHCRHHGILLTLHAENGLLIDELFAKAQSDGRKGIRVLPETRPVISEAEAIRRAGMLARETGCNLYIVHTSSGAGADEIAGLKASGAPIIGETCPQYLYLDDSLFEGTSGHFFSCCPPIRPIIQQKNLWKNLLNRN